MYVFRQLGSLGCSSAHWRLLIIGCAGDTTGEIAATGDGSLFTSGYMMGLLNAGNLRSAIFPTELTISSGAGHGRCDG